MGADRMMVAYQKPANLRSMVIPSRFKPCKGDQRNEGGISVKEGMNAVDGTINANEKIKELDLNRKEIFDHEIAKLNRLLNKRGQNICCNTYSMKAMLRGDIETYSEYNRNNKENSLSAELRQQIFRQ